MMGDKRWGEKVRVQSDGKQKKNKGISTVYATSQWIKNTISSFFDIPSLQNMFQLPNLVLVPCEDRASKVSAPDLIKFPNVKDQTPDVFS